MAKQIPSTDSKEVTGLSIAGRTRILIQRELESYHAITENYFEVRRHNCVTRVRFTVMKFSISSDEIPSRHIIIEKVNL